MAAPTSEEEAPPEMAPLLASPPAPSKKRKRTAQQAIADRQDDPEAGEADGLLELAAAAEPADREYKGIPRFKLGENYNTVDAYWDEYVQWHGVRHMDDNFGQSWMAYYNAETKNGKSVKSPFSKSLDRLKVMVNCVYEESTREQGTCNSSLPVTSKLEIVQRMEAQREELGLSAARYVDSYLRWHLRCLKTVDMPKPDKPAGLVRYLKEGAQCKAAKEAACAAVELAGMAKAD